MSSRAAAIRRVFRAMAVSLPAQNGRHSGDSVRAVIRWRDGRVVDVSRRRPGAVDLVVETADGSVPAVAFPAVVGDPQVGDRVLLNVGALEMGLGTGGFALVVAM